MHRRFALMTLLASIPALCFAATCRVPEEFATIQPAIDACAVGDTVLVGPGTYSGPGNTLLDFHGVDLVLKSTHGSAQTIIDGEAKTRGINLETGETLASRIEGFTVQDCYYEGGVGPGGGMRCSYASVTMDDMVFLNNRDDSGGGGLSIGYGELAMTNSKFENNYGRINGGGLDATSTAVTLSDVEFVGNASNWGGGICIDTSGLPSSLALERVTFIGNRAIHSGGGLCAILYHSDFAIRRCAFIENTTDDWYGGGAFIDNEATGSIEYSLFQGNWADSEGGGFSIQHHSNVTLDHVDFIGNGSFSGCGGLNVYFYCQVVATQCTLYGNRTLYDHGGGVYVASSPLTMDRCIVAASEGAGFYGTGPVTLELICCDVYGNSAGNYTGTAIDQTGIKGTFCEDPQFCGNPGSGNFLLQSDSPCAPGQHDCDSYIGSQSVGCGTTPVEKASISSIKARY